MPLSGYYAAFDDALAQLYRECLLTLSTGEKTGKFEYNDKVFTNAAEWIRKAGQFEPSMLTEQPARDVIDETYRVLNTAISSVITHETPEELTYALQNNAFIFSGFKTYHSLNEVGLSLTDKEGHIKPFDNFYQDVEKINNKYNRNWLEAEYNQAVAAGQMAVKWNDYAKDGDRYNLQYRTAGDERVRADHRVLDGTTLPADDPFWNEYYPPNGWNCRCTVVQVLTDKYELSDSKEAIRKGEEATAEKKEQIFRFNPGEKLKLYPDKHPYYKAPEEVKEELEKVAVSQVKEVKTAEDVASIIEEIDKEKKWFEHGVGKLQVTKKGDINGATDLCGNIWLTPERMDKTILGVNKLLRGGEIEKSEADALSTYWHEITHNRNKIGNIPISRTERRFMELANEFVSRKTLPEFYGAFGADMPFKEFMDDRQTTGYNTMVRNYQKVIEKTGLNIDNVVDAVKNHLFNERYNDQKNGLIKALTGATKKDGTKLKKAEIRDLVTRGGTYSEAYFESVLENIIR